MTVLRSRRCAHCGDQYTYQASGEGCGNKLNDGTWCSDCKHAVLQALAAVPRRYEQRFRNIREMGDVYEHVTLDECKRWEGLARARHESNPRAIFPFARQVFPGLVSADGTDHQNVYLVVAEDGEDRGRAFKVTTWRKSPEVIIEVGQEWDMVKGEWTGRSWP